jgi:hypothetical protein
MSLATTPSFQPPTPNLIQAAFLGVGNWELGVEAARYFNAATPAAAT